MGTEARKAAAAARKLTKEQKRRVREMVEDEGASRAEAIAWVMTFEPEGAK